MTQMLKLLNKDFRKTITNVLKNLEKHIKWIKDGEFQQRNGISEREAKALYTWKLHGFVVWVWESVARRKGETRNSILDMGLSDGD